MWLLRLNFSKERETAEHGALTIRIIDPFSIFISSTNNIPIFLLSHAKKWLAFSVIAISILPFLLPFSSQQSRAESRMFFWQRKLEIKQIAREEMSHEFKIFLVLSRIIKFSRFFEAILKKFCGFSCAKDLFFFLPSTSSLTQFYLTHTRFSRQNNKMGWRRFSHTPHDLKNNAR